jgi:membrane protein DedA with SNARE-associated domain
MRTGIAFDEQAYRMRRRRLNVGLALRLHSFQSAGGGCSGSRMPPAGGAAKQQETVIQAVPGKGSGVLVQGSFALMSSFDGFDLSWLVQFASLLVLPFAHEDLAIVAGAYIVNHNLMPVSLVTLSIYGGIVGSDFALYGIGAGARRLPWLRRYADQRVVRFSETLKRNIFGLVALCRFVPGVVFIAFVACGWARVPFSRFTLASLAISAVYLPLTLYLLIQFGSMLDASIGLWTWPLLLSAMAVFSLARRKVLDFGELATPEFTGTRALAERSGGHRGMPLLPPASRKVALAERIPPGLFYLPLMASWFARGLRRGSLTLPTAANPAIPTGGMWGESKSAYFDDIAESLRNWVAAYAVMRRSTADGERELARALALLADKGIGFPIVAKPDIGWHGYGVRKLDDAAALRDYLARYPVGVALILQSFVPYAGEAAVLYARMPGAPRGRIRSLTLRYFPHVIGDGRSSLRALIHRDPRARWKSSLHLGRDRSHRGVSAGELDRIPANGEVVQIALIGNQRAGGLYYDGRSCITAALEQRFDEIARSMTQFHYGRFDIRFGSVEAMMRGDDFKILEINGIGGEAIDCWDPRLSVWQTYARLFEEQRVLFELGERNRARGFQPTPVREFVNLLRMQTGLIKLYPPSE